MKKLICTAIVMVTMITAASASTPAMTMKSIVEDGVRAQLQVEVRDAVDDRWGFPMKETHIKLFGIEDAFVWTRYVFN